MENTKNLVEVLFSLLVGGWRTTKIDFFFFGAAYLVDHVRTGVCEIWRKFGKFYEFKLDIYTKSDAYFHGSVLMNDN